MEDCDWTDLPSTSSAVLTIDENYITDSSPEKEKDLLERDPKNDGETQTANHIDNSNSSDDINNKENVSSKEKKEKDSCPICLSSFEDRSFLDQCFHSFCFCCILQWCEVVQTCPLCKAGFASVIHNVKSMQDYEQYIIEKKTKSEQVTNNVNIESYDEHGFNERGQRFRYRTTRSVRNNNENSNTRSETREHTYITASRQSRSEGWGTETTTRRRSRYSRTKIKRVEKRRQVYAFNLKATSTLDRGKQRSRNISSQFFKTYQGCTHRLIPWLARDLRVLLGNNEEEVNFLMEFILSLITRIDMDSAEFVQELKPFLLQTTEHFVHELLSFAKAPFDLIAYDDNVVYPWPEESFRSAIPRDGGSIREEREGHSSVDGYVQPVIGSTPLSRCAWSDTPTRLHNQVTLVQDSPSPGDSVQPVEVIPVIEIIDITQGSEKIDDASRKPIEHSQNSVSESCGENSGRDLEEYQSSITQASLKSGAVRKDKATEREEVSTTSKEKECVHRHTHKHVHKHEHKHRHEHQHRHKYKHKHKYEHEHTHKRKHRHRDKHEHRRHRVTDPIFKSVQSDDDDEALPHLSQSPADIDVSQARRSGSEIEQDNTGRSHSPSVEEMRTEIEDLKVLIQQHEKQLSSLTKKTKTI